MSGARGSLDEEFNTDDLPSSPSIISIGKYHNATHHQDGLFSFVYRAESPKEIIEDDPTSKPLHRIVALKVTTPSLMTEPHDSQREARILQQSCHEHIIPLLDVFQQAGGRLVLVFPFLPFDLETVLRKDRLNPESAKSHLSDLFRALEFLHARGIIHRDVKPSNILLKTASGPAYLSDFGIAWSPEDTASEEAHEKITDVGTTSYRPPELLFGNKSYGCSLDLWAAGCVAAECTSLSSRTLFDAGELGSELALIQSIFRSLGTPTLGNWPVNGLPCLCRVPVSPSLTVSRKQQIFRTGGRWPSTSFPPNHGQSYYPKLHQMRGILLASS